MNLFHFLKLVRWKNLFIVAYIFIIFEFVLFPAYKISHKLSSFHFSTLLLSVLLIMSAGYIINDIFDIKTDEINNKDNLISKLISVEKAKRLYLILNTLGISLGVFLCLQTSTPQYSFIFFSAPLLLYYYSKKWKSKPLIGNLIISFLVAFSAIIIVLFEVNFSETIEEIKTVKTITMAFFVFAFIINLIREICKDIEDIKGDYSLKMNTLPILIGRKRTKKITLFLISIMTVNIIFIIIKLASIHKLASLYLLLIVLSSIIYTFFKLKKAKSEKHFKLVNTYLKIVMFLGINSLLILSINNNVL